jgi:hypothetical protein
MPRPQEDTIGRPAGTMESLIFTLFEIQSGITYGEIERKTLCYEIKTRGNALLLQYVRHNACLATRVYFDIQRDLNFFTLPAN